MNSENLMKYLQEIGLFSSIVWWCILIWVIVLNFQAFVWTVQDLIRWVPKIAVAVWQSSKDVRLWSLSATVYHPSAPQNMIKQEWYKKDMESYLKRQFKNIKLSFNLLPPDNYLIIPEIGVQVRLVDTHMVSNEILKHGDFETYLQQGVVKYPNTPDPGTIGNSLLFWHTSLEPWKLTKNKYGTVFRNIPKLKEWSKFSVIRYGEQYDYNVVDKAIKNPQDVKKFYAQYKKDNSYVSLMWCYPIGSDAQRMLVVWELQNPKLAKTQSQGLVAYHKQ
jgi:LPXTG-site transpeptidase (sortase) family protein